MSVDPRTVPIVSIVGRSGSGKTTFLVKLIAELSGRGVRVATAKHVVHHHEADVEGKDSWRHAEAGSVVAMVSSPEKLSFVQKVRHELTLPELARIAFDAGSDVLLTEGYKRDGVNRVEISRRAEGSDLVSTPESLLALVTDMPESAPEGPPVFGLDDARGVADLVQSTVLVARVGA
jgi:molybdopterin-guanine dinucleotide biosynthesis protein B